MTASSPGIGSPGGQLIAGGAFVKTDNNGYIAIGGMGSGTIGNVEILGSVSGGAGIDLSVSAARDVLIDGTINGIESYRASACGPITRAAAPARLSSAELVRSA